MLDYSTYESIFQEERPYILAISNIVDGETGEVVGSLDDLRDLRKLINWRASLVYLSDRVGQELAIPLMQELYNRAWSEYPASVPGFILDAIYQGTPPGREEDGVADRGLSNINKVRKVIIKNKKTGKQLSIDVKSARVSKMRRRVFAWAETIKPVLDNKRYRKVMITLTYKGVDDWRPNHIRDYNKKLKEKLGDKLLSYAWVAELQERGAVHYHMILVVKKGTRIPKPDESGMWSHGHSRIETAKTVFYLCSYLKKKYQKEGEFPKGMRMYGIYIQRGVVSELEYWRFRLSVLPGWFADIIKGLVEFEGFKWSRADGGGWLFANQFFRSPFEIVGFT